MGRYGVPHQDSGVGVRSVFNLNDGVAVRRVFSLDDGVAVRRVFSLDDGVAVRRVSSLDDGVAVRRVSSLDDGVAVRRVSSLDDGVAVRRVFSIDGGSGPSCTVIFHAPEFPLIKAPRLFSHGIPSIDISRSKLADMRIVMQILSEYRLAVFRVLERLQYMGVPELVHILAQENVFGMVLILRQHGEVGPVPLFDSL